MGLLAALYGMICYVIFLGSFLYAIGFIGGFGVPKTIDSGPASDWRIALLIDLALLAAFAVQHSVMARPGFKAAWTRIVPRSVERSTYVLLSSLLLVLLFWKWQALPAAIWTAAMPAARAALQALFGVGWLIVLLSTFMINHFDLFGLRQVFLRLRKRECSPLSFRQRAFYNFVRHPIMLGFLIAFWSTPRMSLGHLLFALATSGYILLGVTIEERDLVAAHGADYEEYRARVPMLLPGARRRARAFEGIHSAPK